MKEGDIDIVELILQHIPSNNIIDEKIILYMKTHKTNCNHFIYEQYQREATFFNTILKSVTCDLSAEILRVLAQKKLI